MDSNVVSIRREEQNYPIDWRTNIGWNVAQMLPDIPGDAAVTIIEAIKLYNYKRNRPVAPADAGKLSVAIYEALNLPRATDGPF